MRTASLQAMAKPAESDPPQAGLAIALRLLGAGNPLTDLGGADLSHGCKERWIGRSPVAW